VIDALAFFGSYPFRRLKLKKLVEVVRHLREKRFEGVYIAHFGSVFYRDPLEGNREALEEYVSSRDEIPKDVSVRVLGGFNPAYIQMKRRFVEEAVSRTFAAYIIAPAYHGFRLDSKEVFKFLDIVYDLGLKVVILDLLEDLREFHRAYTFKYIIKKKHFASFLSGLDKGFRKMIMLASFRYDLLRDSLSRLAELEIYIDISSDSFYGPQYDRVKEVVEAVGDDLVMLSTRTPLAYTEASVFRVLYSDIDSSSKEKILNINAAKFYEHVR